MKIRLIKLIKIVVNGLLLLIVLNLLLVSVAEITYPYQREYRDGAFIDIAHQFITGNNPFTIHNALPHTFTYGFLPSLLLALFSSIFNSDLVLTQRLFTFICILLLSLLVGKEIVKVTKSISLGLVGIVVVLIFNTVSLRPEVLAVLLTTATLYYVHNNKELNFKKILLLSLSIITLYHIKQYFVILFPVLCTYFLFHQPKKNLYLLILTTFVLGTVSFAIINQLFPLYFPETIISYVNLSGGPSTWVMHESNYVFKQSFDFFQFYWLMILLFITATLLGFARKMFVKFDIKNNKKPFVILPPSPLNNVYFMYGFVSILFLTFLLGTNGAAYLTYYYQLLTIPLCVFGINYLYTIIQKQKLREILIIGFTLIFIGEYSQFLAFPDLSQTKQRQAWDRALTYISQHDPQNVYLSPVFTTEVMKRDWPMYDNGQTDFYHMSILTPNSQQFGWVSPHDKEIATRRNQWQKDLDQKIINKKFTLLVFPEGHHAIINDEYLVKYYKLKRKMDVPINFGDLGGPLAPIRLQSNEFWEPK